MNLLETIESVLQQIQVFVILFCYCCLKLYHVFIPPEPQQTTKKMKDVTETDKEIETYYIGRTIYIHY